MKNISLLLIMTVLASCYGREPEKTGLTGKPMPSFKLLLADSVTYFNTKDIPAGKPAVFFYYSPQCPFCRAQMDEIIKSMSLLKDIQFYIFTTWPFASMKEFYTHYQLNKYSNIVAGIDQSYFFVNYFKARGVPYMAIYGKDKILHEAFVGNIDGNQIKKVAQQ